MDDAQLAALALARDICQRRRDRPRYLAAASELFHDPTWEILLELYVCGESNEPSTMMDICARINLSTTTILRNMNELAARGIISIKKCSNDKRRRYVRLTAETREGMFQWLSSSALS